MDAGDGAVDAGDGAVDAGDGAVADAAENHLPVAAFTFGSDPARSQRITFDASASADPDGAIVEYRWDFGDGTRATGQGQIHEFEPGPFTVLLSITDADGATGEVTRSVQIAASTAAAGRMFCLVVGGERTTGQPTADLWSPENCYGYLRDALGQMSGGDTLIIDDGEYTDSDNSITQRSKPPSGTREAMTTIRARNIPGRSTTDVVRFPNGIVPISVPLRARFSGAAVFRDSSGFSGTPTQYVKFEGVHWDGVATASYWDYIYFKQCSSMGVEDGNNSAWSIVGQHNLLEDVIAYGKGRYKYLFYDVSRREQRRGRGFNTCRRCIARHDWAIRDDALLPIAAFMSYYNRDTSLLNSMDIDSNVPEYWSNEPSPLNLMGSFAVFETSETAYVEHRFKVCGSLSINNAYGVGFSATVGNSYVDVVAVNVGGGFFDKLGGNVYDRVALYGVASSAYSYRSNQPTQDVFSVVRDSGFWLSSGVQSDITDVVARGVEGRLFVRAETLADRVYAFNVGEVGGTTTNVTEADPLENGVSYPVRIEQGSPLMTIGTGGGPIGPHVMYRLGTDGSFQGEPGWDTETQIPLWPWPMEAWVQAEMRTSDYSMFCAGAAPPCPSSYRTAAARGFAAAGQSLSNYVWGTLGSVVPPFSVSAIVGDGRAVVSWDAPPGAALASVAGFIVYGIVGEARTQLAVVSDTSVVSVTLLDVPADTQAFAVSAVDADGRESGLAYSAQIVLP
ncbi:MAG: PKD domain-containing protein [Deltaproteobacteria bacterium]|nr:PKD domain-containing protein [Deltaproteobacteria bacterium]